jgi:hypothetical protein
MASVTGHLGSEQIQLDNAATESTLKALLLATAGSEEKMREIMAMAAKVGLDSDSIENANTAVQGQVRVFRLLTKETTQLMNGTASTSGIITTLGEQFSGNLGIAIQGIGKLISIQEENFNTYQKLSASGINFSGSLTSLRLSAANSYLTLDQFSNILKNNSETLARMGGTADDGARAFSMVSKELVQGEVGKRLMAMGYTAEDVNNGLANYITLSGGRNAQEMKDTKGLSAATGEYLNELDDLAQITGKSREQQENVLKEASKNEAWQAYLLTLDEEGKKKANTALIEANAKGGKGAADALQSRLLGLPPMTKAAQEFNAIAPKMAAANNQMADAVGDASKGVGDIKKAGDALGVAANQTKRDLGQTGTALIMQGGTFSSTMGAIFGTANRNAQQGVETLADAEKQREGIEAKRREREDSQASNMSEGMRGLKQLGAELWEVFSPLVSAVSLVAYGLGTVAGWTASLVRGFNSLFDYMGSFGTVIKGAIAAIIAFIAIKKTSALVESVKGGVGGTVGALSSLGGNLSGGGSGFVGFIVSLGMGLAELAPVAGLMLTGAAAISGVIILLGAGVAATIALVGLSLPIFAKGLSEIGKIDGTNLIKVAAGVGALGIAMVAFGAGSVIGGLSTGMSKVVNFFTGGGVIGQIKNTVAELTPILPQLTALGPAINTYAQGIVAFGQAINTVDLVKAEKLKSILKPTATEALQAVGTQMIQAVTKMTNGNNSAEEKMHSEMQALNNTMRDMLNYIKDTAENTKRTHDATKALNGNLFAV